MDVRAHRRSIRGNLETFRAMSLIIVSLCTPFANAFKLDPRNLCPPVIDTEFFPSMANFKSDLLGMDKITIASGKFIVSKQGEKETAIMGLNPTSDFIPNPCQLNSQATTFFSPRNYNDLRTVMGQSNEKETIIFKIKYDEDTKSFSNMNGNFIIGSNDGISDLILNIGIPTVSPTPKQINNKERYGCIYPDKSFAVCPKNSKLSKVLCSKQSQDTREKRRLTNRLDSLVLNHETNINAAVTRMKNILVNKENYTIVNDVLIKPSIEKNKECLPLKIKIHPDSPARFPDLLVSSDEFVDLDEYIRSVNAFMSSLEHNIRLLEQDDFGFDLKLYRPIQHIADYLYSLFNPEIIMFTGPAAALALIILLACCCGMVRCLRPRIQRHNRENSRITLRSLALRTESRPILPPPSYDVSTV